MQRRDSEERLYTLTLILACQLLLQGRTHCIYEVVRRLLSGFIYSLELPFAYQSRKVVREESIYNLEIKLLRRKLCKSIAALL